METIHRERHDYLLKKDSNRQIHVHVDSFTMGLGGYDSWSPNVHEKYLFRSREPVSVNVRMIPVVSMKKYTTNNQDIESLARRVYAEFMCKSQYMIYDMYTIICSLCLPSTRPKLYILYASVSDNVQRSTASTSSADRQNAPSKGVGGHVHVFHGAQRGDPDLNQPLLSPST